MKVLDLFSGIGGFSLGLERAGMKTIAFCEIEDYPCRVLAKHWPNVPIYEDVRNVTKQRLDADGIRPDVICGGFPCQDLSVAGKQAGITGERSGLWGEFARIIGELRPQYAIVENVTALLSGDRGRWFGRVLGDLAEIGYDCEWHCIPASELGAHHHRDRVWIIAHDSGERRGLQQIDEKLKNKAVIDNNGPQESVADTTSQGLPGTIRSRFYSLYEKTRTFKRGIFNGATTKEWGNWAVEPGMGRVANGVPRELDLYRGLINEQSNDQEIDAENLRGLRWRLLRTMWECRKIAKASPDLYRERLRDSLPEVPHENTHGGWYLGACIEESKRLRDLWEAFYSKSFQEAQNLQQELLERIRKIERTKEVGPAKNRVDRIKGLGNAVVPQIPEIIGRAIMSQSTTKDQ